MFSTPWNQKTVAQRLLTIGAMIGIFFSGVIVAFAISNYIDHGSFGVKNTIDHIFTIDLTGEVAPVALGPGGTQSISPSIKNTGTEKMYVFVRFNCSDDGIYSFTQTGSGWSKVETIGAGEMLYVYGEPTKLSPGESATLSGTMTVIADNVAFSEFESDDALYYTVTGCAIGTDAENTDPALLYGEYLSSGGE